MSWGEYTPESIELTKRAFFALGQSLAKDHQQNIYAALLKEATMPESTKPKVRSLGQVIEIPNLSQESNPVVVSWDGKSDCITIIDQAGIEVMTHIPSISRESAEILSEVLATFAKHGVLELQ